MTRGSLIVGSLCLFTSVAQAHISVDLGGTHKSRYADAGLKGSPCGMAGGKRGTNIFTYKPGATITVSISETIPHPGYFRVAFDNDGDDGFVTPSGTEGAMGACAGDPKCGPGKADYCNNDSVLLDNLDAPGPHSFGTKHTFSVTLPNVECTNCTLQIIQVMNDLNIHGAPYPADDVYYQCIDLVLSKTAMDVMPPATPVVNNGMVCKGAAPAGTGGMAAAGGSGGMAMTGAGGTGGVPAAMTGGTPAVVPPAGSGGGAAAGSVGVPPAGAGGMTAPVAGGAAVPPVTTPGSGSKADSGGCSAMGGSSPLGLVGMFGLALLPLMRRRNNLRA
jgi:MYXO-CTERM domain-containing protein